jgi:hypothetical protein
LKAGTWKTFPTRVEVSAQISDVMFACYASALGAGRVKLPTQFEDNLIERIEGLPK